MHVRNESGRGPVLTRIITSKVWNNLFTPLFHSASGDSDQQGARNRTVQTNISALERLYKEEKMALLSALKLTPISSFC